jgi:Fe-S cluster assembly protein SufD
MSQSLRNQPVSGTKPLSSKDRHAYLAHLLALATAMARQSSIALDPLREMARALVEEQTFPSSRDEAWRFTDLSGMLTTPYQVPEPWNATSLSLLRSQISGLMLTEGYRLVFVNGHYVPELSTLEHLPTGVTVAPLSQLSSDPLMPYLAKVPDHNEVFTALNTVGFVDAAVIQLEKNQVVTAPIQIVNLVTKGSVLVQPRCLVVAAANSALTLVEEFLGEGTNFTNSVTEIWLADNAQVHHVRLQQESLETTHIGKTAISQGRDSHYQGTAINLGGQRCRHHWQVFQTGPQTDTQLFGLNAIQGQQLADTHSLISLAHPYGTAHQLHKNIVDHQAHAVFNGQIRVPHAAQMTNAAQLNRNLMLSTKARIDTKPELDIVADNVKCAHGATVSQLKPDELFYLQSRGIDQAQAQRLLIYAFAMEIIETINIAALKARLTQYITEWTH